MPRQWLAGKRSATCSPMFGLSKTFSLDPRLEADTIAIPGQLHFTTRLMNDRRWPWIIVVPQVPDATDIEHLHHGGLEPLIGHLADISKTLKEMGVADSTNVGSLGNVVTQMHWHVVGRREGDPNWPGPVWGFGEREPYSKGDAKRFIDEFNEAWKRAVPFLRRLP